MYLGQASGTKPWNSVTRTNGTDNAIVRFDGTLGEIQNSNVFVDDNGNLGVGMSAPTHRIGVGSTGSTNCFISTQNGNGTALFGTQGTDGAMYAWSNDASRCIIGTSKSTGYVDVYAGGSARFRVDSDGTLKAVDGLVATPAYTFTNDPNTGMYRIGTDSIGLVTGGISRLEIGATGNVTINGSTAQRIAQSASIMSTSGTAIDFTGIPSWVKRITIMLNGVSTTGTSVLIAQLGSGSFTTSGYYSSNTGYSSTGVAGTTTTTGIALDGGLNDPNNLLTGTCVINNLYSTAWIATSCTQKDSAAVQSTGNGKVQLAGVLDRVRITTVNGTDTFDSGNISLIYEG